jgi:hypothetical protein
MSVRDLCEFRGPTWAAATKLLDGNVAELGDMLALIFAEPVVFGAQQERFHACLEARNAFVDVRPHEARCVEVQRVGVGLGLVQAAPLVHALCELLCDDSVCTSNASLTAVPFRVARALLFWAPERNFPLRDWMLRRFLAPDSVDARVWQGSRSSGGFQLLQTEEYLDMTYFESAVRAADAARQHEQVCIEQRATLRNDSSVVQWTHSAAVLRVMELTVPRMLLAFYSLFLHRMFGASCEQPQQLWELALTMLTNWRAGPLEGAADHVPMPVMGLVAEVAEQMRAFMRAPLVAGTELVRALYARTSDFDKLVVANLGVRAMLLDVDKTRRFAEVFYVPVKEVSLSSLVVRLFGGPQLMQMHRLMGWLWSISQFSIADALSAEPAHAARCMALDAEMYACRLPPGVHAHRLRWTLERLERMHPTLLGPLVAETFVGLDETNRPFMVMRRARMDHVRLIMLTDALTMRSYRKSTALYPLLLRLYLTHRPNDDAYNTLAMQSFTNILAYWLCINEPELLPGPAEVVEHVSLLHRVVGLLEMAELGMDAINLVRAFLQLYTPHRLSTKLRERLAEAMVFVSGVPPGLREALHVLQLIQLPTRQPRGCPRQPTRCRRTRSSFAGYMTDIASSQIFLRTLRSLYPNNPLATCGAAATSTALFNRWIYAAMTHPGVPRHIARDMLHEFTVDRLAIERDYRSARYQMPLDVAAAWQQSNSMFLNTPALRYCHANHQLRPTMENAGIAELVRFMQKLEQYVCTAGTSTQPAPTSPADAAMVQHLYELYRDPERVLRAMPVTSYVKATTGTHEMVNWETALAIADTLPPVTSTHGAQCPTARAINGETGASALSDAALDVVTMYSNCFDETTATLPGADHAVFKALVDRRQGKR